MSEFDADEIIAETKNKSLREIRNDSGVERGMSEREELEKQWAGEQTMQPYSDGIYADEANQLLDQLKDEMAKTLWLKKENAELKKERDELAIRWDRLKNNLLGEKEGLYSNCHNIAKIMTEMEQGV